MRFGTNKKIDFTLKNINNTLVYLFSNEFWINWI